MSHVQMIDAIGEIAAIDPSPAIAALALPAKMAIRIAAMTGDELAGRLAGDPAAAIEMLDELADARRYLAALSGLFENAEARMLAALS